MVDDLQGSGSEEGFVDRSTDHIDHGQEKRRTPPEGEADGILPMKDLYDAEDDRRINTNAEHKTEETGDKRRSGQNVSRNVIIERS